MSGDSERRAVPGLASPLPLGGRLPSIYADDDFACRLAGAFDEVLAPALSTLDCLDSYWDARLAPADFLDWLARWLAAEPPAWLPVERRRELVARAVGQHAVRGTVHGLAEQIRLVFGVEAEITDSGGASWSAVPGEPVTGPPEPWLTVRVQVADPASVPLVALRALVEANCPAHVPCTVEVGSREMS